MLSILPCRPSCSLATTCWCGPSREPLSERELAKRIADLEVRGACRAGRGEGGRRREDAVWVRRVLAQRDTSVRCHDSHLAWVRVDGGGGRGIGNVRAGRGSRWAGGRGNSLPMLIMYCCATNPCSEPITTGHTMRLPWPASYLRWRRRSRSTRPKSSGRPSSLPLSSHSPLPRLLFR